MCTSSPTQTALPHSADMETFLARATADAQSVPAGQPFDVEIPACITTQDAVLELVRRLDAAYRE